MPTATSVVLSRPGQLPGAVACSSADLNAMAPPGATVADPDAPAPDVSGFTDTDIPQRQHVVVVEPVGGELRLGGR